MPAERRESRVPEQVRGVGLVVLLGGAVLLTGLAIVAVFVWIMA